MRLIVIGSRADLEKLSAEVDARLGFPMLGRNAATGEAVPAERGGVTYRAGDVVDDPKDPERCGYELTTLVADVARDVLRDSQADARVEERERLAADWDVAQERERGTR